MDKQKARERIKKLRREISYHRYLYHALDRQEISDAALDSLKHELAKLEAEFPDLITPDSPTQRVAGKPLPGFRKVKHSSPMLSLQDAFSEEEIKEWEERIKKLTTNSLNYFAELKIDGFAISLTYENGVLKVGSTRGDGKIGEDVTENLKTIESIPLRLHDISELNKEGEIKNLLKKYLRVEKAVSKIPQILEVRGEAYMTNAAFEKVNRRQKKRGLPSFANPRNIASGSIRQLDPKVTAARQLDFLAYDVVTDLGQETHEEKHLIAKLFGFKTIRYAKYCKDLNAVIGFWKEILKKRERLPFLIDGIVVQVNSGRLFEKLGVAGKAPRGAIAFKFPAKEATTLVEDILVQVGRTGVLTPVAALKPVEVSGVMVSRATLHNMDEILRLDVRVGDTVVVRRAGDVIPDIVKVIKNLRPKNSKKFSMPKTFCGQSVIRRSGEVAHRIARPEKCDLVTREKFYHFVSKKAFDIDGLGPKIVDHLLDEGLVSDPADLFLLKEADIKPLERFAEKSAENLVRSIQSKKEIELHSFIYALGMPHVGEETAIDLTRYFGTLEKLDKTTLEHLKSIQNIGPVVAESIFNWFREKGNRDLVKKLLLLGVKIKTHKLPPANRQLKGKIFVLTGGLKSMTRDKAKEKIRGLGGEISESVSKKTDYVIVGSEAGSKLEKANKLAVKTINEKEFIKLAG